MKLTLYVDGAARGNPGPAGIGIILLDGERVVFRGKEYLGEKTNNEAEYLALIYGLEQALKWTKELEVFSDSQLLVSQIKGEFKLKKDNLKRFFNRAKELIAKFFIFSIEHTFRDLNKRADELANQAIDEYFKGERKVKELESIAKQDKLF